MYKYSNSNLLKILLFILICGLYSNVPAQNFHSVHQEQSQQFRSVPQLPVVMSQNHFFKSKGTKSNAIIFGYLPDWGYPYTNSYLRYDILTHIAVFDFQADSTGSMTNPLKWPWTDVISLSHQNDVKVIMCVTNFSAASIHALMNSSTYKAAFYSNIMKIINANNLDGVNIDFEGLYQEDQGSVLNTFMGDLATYVKGQKPGAEISFAGPAITSNYYYLMGLANVCDYIFIMAYNYHGSWSTTTGGCAPLTGGTYNVTNTMNVQYGSVTTNAPQKLILGLPYYGVRWNTTSNTEYSSVRKFITYSLYADDAVSAQAAGVKWCAGEQVPWYVTTADTGYTQTWFDSDSSLGLKYKYAQSKNYGGVGIWALGYDRDRPELWNKLYELFYEPNSVHDEHAAKGNENFRLRQNYPNPFNPSTTIAFDLTYPASVKIIVYDAMGRQYATLVDDQFAAGSHSVVFDGSNLTSGLYTAVLTSNSGRNVIKMILVK